MNQSSDRTSPLLPVLVVDDDIQIAQLHARTLRTVGLEAHLCQSGEEALAYLNEHPESAAVLLDLMMPGIGGLETLRQLHAHEPHLPVIVVSGQDKVSVAIEAIREGAYDYLIKPVSEETLTTVVKHAVAHHRVSSELARLRREIRNNHSFDRMVARSGSMRKVFSLIEKTLHNDITVLILGESGTGKELVARAVHFNSLRSEKPFVAVNCAAIPRELVESELFGHERGSFTGAVQQRIGRFEQANGGTLFLDEIGELDLAVQAKLLRALQEREIDRVGGTRPIPVDVRLVCATQRNLEDEVANGTFREDLFYRVNAYPIDLPPLRDREEDVELLVAHFIDRQSHHLGRKEIVGITHEALSALKAFDWPGNVRQLENVIGRAVVLAEDSIIRASDLPESISELAGSEESDVFLVKVPNGESAEFDTIVPSSDSVQQTNGGLPKFHSTDDIPTLDEIKAWAIRQAYNACEGNISLAAKKLGLGRATFYRLLKKYDIAVVGADNTEGEDETGDDA